MRSLRYSGLLAAVTFLGAGAVAGAAPLVSDTNLFWDGVNPGLTTNAANEEHSSDFDLTKYNVTFATNGQGGGDFKDYVFAHADLDQRLSLTGFSSASQIGTLRLWTADDLRPTRITVYTASTSLDGAPAINTANAAYGGAPFIDIPAPTYTAGTGTSAGLLYIDISNLPVGTQTILFDFGDNLNGPNGSGFRRVAEVQAFTVPEPASLGLLGIAGLAGLSRRRRA